MIVDCIADTHGNYPKLEGGDLLIVAGDLTARDTIEENTSFLRWFSEQDYTKKILIAGNHDNKLVGPWPGGSKGPFREDKTFYDFDYLCDSGTEFVVYPDLRTMEEGKTYQRPKVKIWGSPWTRSFPGMNPDCKAFVVDTEEELAEKWALIPDDVDILVTHSPAYGMRDTMKNYNTGKIECVGSKSLQMELFTRLRPKLMVVGHIHEGYGEEARGGIVDRYVNASHVNEHYKPVNKPIRIIL